MKKRFLSSVVMLFLSMHLFARLATGAEAADGEISQQLRMAPPDSEEVASPPFYLLDTAALEEAMRAAKLEIRPLPFGQIEQWLDEPPDETDQGVLAAGIITCIFFGWLGIHRLVLGGRAALMFFYCMTSLTLCGLAIPMVDLLFMIRDSERGGKSRFDKNDYWIAW